MADHEHGTTQAELVTFSPTDAANPKNWSKGSKRINVLLVCILVFVR